MLESHRGCARVAELADARDLKSLGPKRPVPVQSRPRVPTAIRIWAMDSRSYSRRLLTRLNPYVLACASLCALAPQGMAQVAPTPANPQNPSTQSLQAGVDTSLLAVTPTAGTTSSVSAVQGIASISSSTRPGSLRSAGQGLPGMPGGPPLKGSLGYQDPSSAYMRPTTIGPLVCDPLLDGACD